MSVIINDPFLAEAFKAINEETVRSRAKHPDYPADQLRQTAITLEEILEAATELLKSASRLQQATLQIARVGSDAVPLTQDDLRKELIHAASMCVKQLTAMAEREHAEATREAARRDA